MFKLTGHTKLALFIAPLLVLVGWVGGEIWAESQAMKTKIYNLKAESDFCDVMAKKCVLTSGDVKFSLYQEGNTTTLNSTFPLDTATLFLVNGDDISAYRMGMIESPYYWHQVTDFAEKNSAPGSKQVLRIIATVKGSKYIAEVTSHTIGKGISTK